MDKACVFQSRRAYLLASTAILLAGAIAMAPPALASNECGPLADEVTCTSAGNNYPNGIDYEPVTDLTLIVEDGVNIDSGANDGINITRVSPNTPNIYLYVYDTDSTVDIMTSDDGIYVRGSFDPDYSVTIRNEAEITSGGYGIRTRYTTNVNIDNSGGIVSVKDGIRMAANAAAVNQSSLFAITNSGTIQTTGGSANGITASGSGTTNNSGTIITHGNGGDGIDATAYGLVNIYNDGEIETYGESAHGIRIGAGSGGRPRAYSSGTITTHDKSSRGIYVGAGDNVVVTVSGDIVTGKNYKDDPTTNSYAQGILVKNSPGYAKVKLEEGGGIATYGGQAHGIYVLSVGDNAATDYVKVEVYDDIVTDGENSLGIFVKDTVGDVTVTGSGGITTDGNYAHGIYVWNTSDDVTIDVSGPIVINGDEAYGINVDATDGDLVVKLSGSVDTSGDDSHAIYIHENYGLVDIEVSGSVTTSGLDASGISLRQNTGAVTIDISGPVSGGSGDGAGIEIVDDYAASVVITIASGGTLGAVSDRAILSAESNLTINNYGTITGIVELGAGDDVFNNFSSNSWLLRDEGAVATADFGDGDDDTFNNYGALRLAKVAGQTLWVGALTGLENFNHNSGGDIDLADGIAGDQLAISGAFVSNGGAIHLDAVLDDGSSSPQADVLTLETVTLGTGPTLVYVENADGSAGLTTGDGIKIIDTTASATGAFELASRLRSGAFEYELLEIDEDWYLSSFLIAATAEYPALLSAALSSWQSDLGFLHDRMKALVAGDNAPIEPAGYSYGDARGGAWLNAAAARQEIDTGAAYEQRIGRLEGGLDRGFELAGGEFGFGLFGGYGQSWQEFEASTSEAKSDFAAGGAYAAYRYGALYNEALIKYEHHWADYWGDSTDGEEEAFDADVLGGSFESGLRLAAASFAAVPHLRVTYAHVFGGSFEDATGETVELEKGESLLGEIALRLDANPWGQGSLGLLSIEGGVRHEFLGESEAEVSGLTFTHALPGTVGFAASNLDLVLLEDTLALALRAEYAKGSEAEEFSGTLSLKLEL